MNDDAWINESVGGSIRLPDPKMMPKMMAVPSVKPSCFFIWTFPLSLSHLLLPAGADSLVGDTNGISVGDCTLFAVIVFLFSKFPFCDSNNFDQFDSTWWNEVNDLKIRIKNGKKTCKQSAQILEFVFACVDFRLYRSVCWKRANRLFKSIENERKRSLRFGRSR